MFRQGDVLIFATASPESLGAEIVADGIGPLLIRSERTGHHHSVVAYPETYDPETDLPAYRPAGYAHSLREWATAILVDAVGRTQAHTSTAAAPAARLFHTATNDRLLHVLRHTLVRHDEHPAIPLAPGHYTVRVQQKFQLDGWGQVGD